MLSGKCDLDISVDDVMNPKSNSALLQGSFRDIQRCLRYAHLPRRLLLFGMYHPFDVEAVFRNQNLLGRFQRHNGNENVQDEHAWSVSRYILSYDPLEHLLLAPCTLSIYSSHCFKLRAQFWSLYSWGSRGKAFFNVITFFLFIYTSFLNFFGQKSICFKHTSYSKQITSLRFGVFILRDDLFIGALVVSNRSGPAVQNNTTLSAHARAPLPVPSSALLPATTVTLASYPTYL